MSIGETPHGAAGILPRLGGLLLDLIYPRRAVCLGCGDMTGLDRDDLCEDCRARLATDWIGVREPAKRSRLDGCAFAYRYEGPAGALVRRLKYSGVRVLVPEMGLSLTRAVELMQLKQLDAVTSVPMPPGRLRKRGFNQAELLARAVAERTGISYRELLERTREDTRQAELSRTERWRNLKGAFAVRADAPALNGARILLIDDVCTTGSTAKSCADALRRAGAAKVYFAAYARARDA